MEQWQYLLAAGLAVSLVLALAVRSAVIKKRKAKQRDFDRKLETVLQPKETVKVVYPQKKGHCILTSKRLLLETGEGFTAVPFSRIKSVQGVTAEGKKTTSAAKMASVTIKAGQEYVLHNNSEAFVELVKQLKSKVSAKKKSSRSTPKTQR